jgi:hypothetical protein
MKKIKLSINSPKEGLLRQTPNNDGIWEDYKFYINESVEECDYWVIYSKGEKQNNQTIVSKENLILLTGEPEPIYHYAPRFISKFGKVLTSRKDINHSNLTHIQPAQPWWVGRKMLQNGSIEFGSDFNQLSKPVQNKKKLISVITSLKGFTQGHKDRINFVKKLKNHFGDQLDVFGKGINGFEDKWDTLRDYKYHIVIENSSFDDYWTEKLADNYLAECFPFYHGCKNIDKYFDKSAYNLIDINHFEASVEIIEAGIAQNLYEKRYEAITEAKRKVMNEYNIFPMLIKQLEAQNHNGYIKKNISMKHENSYVDFYKIWMILKRFYIKKFK